MVEWSLASLILSTLAVCVTIAISPVVLSNLNKLRMGVMNLFSPAAKRCKRITREDVSLRSLHTCGRLKSNNPPKYAHTAVPDGPTAISTPYPARCLYSLPSDFIILKDPKQEIFVKKPSELEDDKTYIRMDMWTLGAYLLHWQDALHWKDRIPHPRVEIKEIGDILIAQVIADRQEIPIRPIPTVCQLTKTDVDGILRGYPPQYREFLFTMSGEVVKNPIRDVLDIERGGWIAAIGLCRPFVIGKHRMSKPKIGPEESLAPLLYVVHPFKRIVEVLGNFEKAFGGHGNLPQVCEMAQGIRTRDRSTTSRSEVWFFDSQLLVPHGGRAIESGEYLKDLTANQCQTAMNAFNHYGPPSAEEIGILKPVLAKVLVAVLHGMFKAAEWDEKAGVLDYLDMTGLDTPTRAVYVMERYGEEKA